MYREGFHCPHVMIPWGRGGAEVRRGSITRGIPNTKTNETCVVMGLVLRAEDEGKRTRARRLSGGRRVGAVIVTVSSAHNSLHLRPIPV